MSAAAGDEDALTVSSMIKEIQGLKDKFKDEDEELPSPFQVCGHAPASYLVLAPRVEGGGGTQDLEAGGGHRPSSLC